MIFCRTREKERIVKTGEHRCHCRVVCLFCAAPEMIPTPKDSIPRINWGSFRGRFGDHFRVGDHFGGCTVPRVGTTDVVLTAVRVGL